MAGYQNSQLYAGLKESNLYILTEFFKMLGNPTHIRIRILLLLMEQDAHVSDLAEQLGMTQSEVSHLGAFQPCGFKRGSVIGK